jgi:hypothetical protein
VLGLGAQFLEQRGDFRQLRQATGFGQQRQEAGERLAGTLRSQQRGDLRIGGDARGKAERVGPRDEGAFVTRGREGGTGVGTGDG